MKSKERSDGVLGAKWDIKIIEQPAEYVPVLFQKGGKEVGRIEVKGDTIIFKGKMNIDLAKEN